MANMALGGYTFAQNPAEADSTIGKNRVVSSVNTFDGVHVFSWGARLAGKTITLKWKVMPTAMFTQLRTLFEGDTSVVFDPQDGSAKTYNVQIMELEGAYLIYLEDAAGNFRKDVKLKLLIQSEV